MYRSFQRPFLATLAATLLLTAGASTVRAQDALAATTTTQSAFDVQGGRTTVALSSAFLNALQNLKVTAGTATPTELAAGKLNFPITSGVVDLATAKIQLLHSGGITLSAGNDWVEIGNFIIDTTGNIPKITGTVTVNGTLLGRIAVFKLVLPSGIKLPLAPSDGALKVPGVTVLLSTVAAADLNAVFHVNAFSGALLVGTAEVNALLPWNAR